MKNGKILALVLVLLLVITGFVVFKTLKKNFVAQTTPVENIEPTSETLPEIDPSINVTVVMGKNNTITMAVDGMKGNMTEIEYEITYESGGRITGVNSGSKAIDVSGDDELSREVYLGTCSKNVCKPDTGVKSVTVALKFTDKSGKKSQFNKDFEL